MKIYVICDLEGVAGVVDHRQQCQWDSAKGWYAPFLAQARRLATLELNALVEGALEGCATEVVAWDGHGNFPGGLNVELLHPECKLVMDGGSGGPTGLDTSFSEPPFRLRVQYKTEQSAARCAAQRKVKRLDSVTVEMERAEFPWMLL